MKFCPKCGKKTNQLFNDLCRDCSANTTELFNYKPKDVTICVFCNIIHDGKKQYKALDQESSIVEVIKKRIELNETLKKPIFDVSFKMPHHYPKHGAKFLTHAQFHLVCKTEGNVEIDEYYELPFEIRYITCERCSKKNTNYFEGILQIRHDDKKRVNEVLEKLDKIMVEQGKRSVFATNMIESKKGVDVYITSQKHIKEIGKQLFEKFGGEIKINEQLFSRNSQTSKELYRVNVLIRLPDFQTGCAIFVKNKLLFIKRIKGNNIIGKDLRLNKTVNVYVKGEKIKLIASREDIKPATITVIKPQIEILNPNNYQSETVMNPEAIVKPEIGQKLKVFESNGLWVVG